MSGAIAGTSAAGGGAGSSNSKRRRKNQSSRSNRMQSSGHSGHPGGFAGPPGQHHFGPGHPRGGGGGGGGGPINNQMPPPGMHPHAPQSTGMGLGTTINEDPIDFILDDLDKLTGRDIALTRYKRNHELINLIFDARKIDSLRPTSSPYAEKDQNSLRSQLTKYEEEIENLRSNYSTKFLQWRDELREHDDLLHAPPKRIRVQLEEREQKRKDEADLNEFDGHGQSVPSWASMPGSGEVIGVGFIRQQTPEEVRELLPKAPEPEPEPEPEPKPSSSVTPSQSQTNNEIKPSLTTTENLSTNPSSQSAETSTSQEVTNLVGTQAVSGDIAVSNPTSESIQHQPNLPSTVQTQSLDVKDPASVHVTSDANLPTSTLMDPMDLNEDGGEEEDEDNEGSEDQDDEQHDEDDDGEAEDDDSGLVEENADAQNDVNLEMANNEVDQKTEFPTVEQSQVAIPANSEAPPVEQIELQTPFDANMAESLINDDTFATAADDTQDPSSISEIALQGVESNDVEMNLDDLVQHDEVPQALQSDSVEINEAANEAIKEGDAVLQSNITNQDSVNQAEPVLELSQAPDGT